MKEYRRILTKINGQDTMMDTEDCNYKDGVITINGEITDDLAAGINSAIIHWAKSSKEDIVLYINSPGGSVTAGMSIYDTCKLCGCDVVTVATGMAASMGSFLLTAAGTKGKRYAHPNAEIMIHQPLGGASGQASDIQICAQHITKVKDRLNEILAQATGQSKKVIQRDTDRDNFMFADEALKYGLIDIIGDPLFKEEKDE